MSNDDTGISVKNRDILNLLKALSALDGRPTPVTVKDKDREVTQIVIKPYSFSGTARLAMARALVAVKDVNDALSRTHDGLVKQFADPADPTQVSDANMQAFTDEWEKVLDAAVVLKFARISCTELRVEENQLPVSVLAALDPLLV